MGKPILPYSVSRSLTTRSFKKNGLFPWIWVLMRKEEKCSSTMFSWLWIGLGIQNVIIDVLLQVKKNYYHKPKMCSNKYISEMSKYLILFLFIFYFFYSCSVTHFFSLPHSLVCSETLKAMFCFIFEKLSTNVVFVKMCLYTWLHCITETFHFFCKNTISLPKYGTFLIITAIYAINFVLSEQKIKNLWSSGKNFPYLLKTLWQYLECCHHVHYIIVLHTMILLCIMSARNKTVTELHC